MTLFVTGATGVLGRPVLRRLRALGKDVKALCRSESNRKTLERLGAQPVEADLFNPESMAIAMAGCEAVLHLATRIPASKDLKKKGVWDENDRIRREGTEAIVQAAARNDDLRTIVYPSISFFYGDAGDRTIDASSATVAIIDPMQSTLDAETEIRKLTARLPDRRGIILRFGAFYGPTSPDSRQLLAMARKGFALPFARPAAYRSSIWIDDAAAAVIDALETAPGGIFDVVDDEPLTQAESIAALAAAVDRKKLWTLPRWLLKLALPADLRDVAGRSQRISNARFRDATGWVPKVPSQRVGWRLMAEADRKEMIDRGSWPRQSGHDSAGGTSKGAVAQ